MRFLILSDIHANREALEAVLAHAEGLYDRILCAGDLVDYGADPDAVVDWARREAPVLVRGNHDKVCAGLEDMEWFSPAAQASAVWTQESLSAANLDYLRNLPRGPLAIGGFQILHGSPLDEDEYLLGLSDFRMIRPYLECPLSFFGHSHMQGGFYALRGAVAEIPRVPPDAGERVFEIPENCLCLANPGSVGQPRDGDPRAGYLIYSHEESLMRYRRVRYDIETAQKKIRAAGLPLSQADRLAVGK